MLSTSKVEYIVTILATYQAILLRRFLKDLYQEQKKVTEIFYDNKSIIAMTKNSIVHRKTKHIEMLSFYLGSFSKWSHNNEVLWHK